MKKPKKSRKLLWAVIATAAVIVLAGGFLLYRTGFLGSVFRNKDIVARVGTHNITKQEVQSVKQDATLAGFYVGSDEDIRDLIMNYWLYGLVAKEYGINPTDSQALDYLNNRISPTKPQVKLDINNKYVKYRAYSDYNQNQINTIIRTPQVGSYILAHFDQNFGRDTTQLKDLSDQQYADLLKADKDYATNFINNVYSKIKSKEISFEQGMKLQIDDPLIGKKALPTGVQSANFGQPSKNYTETQSISKNSQIQKKLNELKAGEISEPFIVKVPSGPGDSENFVDGFWIIAKVDSVTKGPIFDNINAALQYFKNKYGYEVYN